MDLKKLAIKHRVKRGLGVKFYGYEAITECGLAISSDVRVTRYWMSVDCKDCLMIKGRRIDHG